MVANSKSNKQLVEEFFSLITEGFHAEPVTDEDQINVEFQSLMLQRTKPWRREVWKKFYEIEERLCPRPAKQARPDYVAKIAARR